LNRQELHIVTEIFHFYVLVDKGVTVEQRLEVSHIVMFRRTINDHINVITGIGNDRIVQNATRFVGDQ
jgi:hypothetical protein